MVARLLAGSAIALVVFILLAPAALALGSERPALVQGTERIVSWDIAATIGADAVVRFDETLVYDFGRVGEFHGIYREVIDQERFDERDDRVYDIEVLTATANGAPVPVSIDDAGNRKRIRLGDADVLVSGVVTYTLSYEVAGALNAFAEHDELFWNVVDQTTATVAAENVSVSIAGPAPVLQALCFAGPVDSTLSCDSVVVDESGVARFTHASVPVGQILTIVVAEPAAAIDVPPPRLRERWSLRRAFSVNERTVSASAALLGVGSAAVGTLAWRRGRDRQAVGGPIEAVFPSVGGRTERVPLFGELIAPVEYMPPDGLRPGLVGTIVDHEVNASDIAATVVDLAVRGYLRIDEMEKRFFRRQDYRLVQLKEPDAELLEYERRLLDRLFATSSEVELSDLRGRFASSYSSVRNAMYAEAMRLRWFDRRPDRLSDRWEALGIMIVIAGVSLGGLLAWRTHWAILAVPVILVGLLVWAIVPRVIPARTARGTAAMRRCLGFRDFIVNSEANRAQFAERRHLFTEYLPYAVVFEATEKWAETFADLGVDVQEAAAGFYTGTRHFDAGNFSDAMGGFADSVSSSLSVTPGASGGSGFSGGGSAGGGGGGGGAGSW